MSIDLTRPLVSSMGHHDPLDGLITYLELQSGAGLEPEGRAGLATPIAETTEMCRDARWATDDPLGIGGLLDDATRLAPLVFGRGVKCQKLLEQILLEAELSLEALGSSFLDHHASHRLAFRELGLAIGISGLERIRALADRSEELAALVASLLLHRPVAEAIRAFWSDATHRRGSTWIEHRDINTVMLATSLAPAGYFS